MFFQKFIDERGFIDITPLSALPWRCVKRSRYTPYISKAAASDVEHRLFLTPRGRVVQFARRPCENRQNYGCYVIELAPDYDILYLYQSALLGLTDRPAVCEYLFMRHYGKNEAKNEAKYEK